MNEVDICIVGLGPAGLGAALAIADSRKVLTTLCLESGPPATRRSCAILDGNNCRWAQPCEVISGIGGAALMSSGKVSTHPAGEAMRLLMPRSTSLEECLDQALTAFQAFVPTKPHHLSADAHTLAAAYYAGKGFRFRYYAAHRFTHDAIVNGVTKMVDAISAAGLDVRTNATVKDIREWGSGFEIDVRSPTSNYVVRARHVLLATGRSGNTLVARLLQSKLIQDEPGHIDLGVRLEFPLEAWSDIDRYHNDLKLHVDDARTFCVCKGGLLAPYRMDKIFLMEGHSDPNFETGFSNLAITVRSPRNGASEWVDLQRRLLLESNGRPVAQNLLEYLNENSASGYLELPHSSIKHWKSGIVGNCFDEATNDRLASAVRLLCSAFISREQWRAVSVFAPEADYYWPKLRLGSVFMAGRPGLFVGGDASGHFRGILQAFASGRQIGSEMLREYS